jgi:hypothetical protein
LVSWSQSIIAMNYIVMNRLNCCLRKYEDWIKLFLKSPSSFNIAIFTIRPGWFSGCRGNEAHEQYYCMQRKFSKNTRLIKQLFVYSWVFVALDKARKKKWMNLEFLKKYFISAKTSVNYICSLWWSDIIWMGTE